MLASSASASSPFRRRGADRPMRTGLIASAAFHLALLAWGLIALTASPLDASHIETLPVEFVEVTELTDLDLGKEFGRRGREAVAQRPVGEDCRGAAAPSRYARRGGSDPAAAASTTRDRVPSGCRQSRSRRPARRSRAGAAPGDRRRGTAARALTPATGGRRAAEPSHTSRSARAADAARPGGA